MKHIQYIMAFTTMVTVTGVSPVVAVDAPTVKGIEHENVGRKGRYIINEEKLILTAPQMEQIKAGGGSAQGAGNPVEDVSASQPILYGSKPITNGGEE